MPTVDLGSVEDLPNPTPAPCTPTPLLPPPPLPGEATQLKAGDPRTRAIASAGGRAAKLKRDQLKALTGLGVSENSKLMQDPEYAEYVEAALEFAKHEIARLAREVGGGVCPPNAASQVVAAARAMIWGSKAAADCDAIMAMKADVSAKGHILAAYEICAREGKYRKNKKSSHSKIEEGLARLDDEEDEE